MKLEAALFGLLFVSGCRSCAAPPPAPLDASVADAAVDAGVPDGALAKIDAAPDEDEAACDTYATTLCTREESCSKATFRLDHADHDSCVLATKFACLRESHAPSTGFTTPQVLACAAALTKRGCGLWNDLEDMDIAECHPKGKLAVGARCDWDSQCESGVSGGRERKCMYDAMTGGDLLASFFGDRPADTRCPHGMMQARGVCLKIAYPGQACHLSAAPYDPCILSFCEEGFCKRDKGCGTELDATKCGRWRVCNELKDACENITIVTEGGACTDERHQCYGGARCLKGICVRLNRPGELCGPGGCLDPAVCVDGKCVVP